jgi:hypothetical protein
MGEETLVEVVILIIALVTMILQAAEVFLTWYVLREVGDLDQDKDDWWEKGQKK